MDTRSSPRLGQTIQRALRERRYRSAAAFVVLVFAGLALYSMRTDESWTPFDRGLIQEGGLEVAGTPQEVMDWSEQEQLMREYSWGPVPPHASLQSMVDELSEVRSSLMRHVIRSLILFQPQDQQRVRAWLLKSRPLSQAGVGIGLGSSSPPKDIRPASPAPRHEGMPPRREGPGTYEGGSSSK